MRNRLLGATLMVGLAGCSQNASKLASNADPKVCASSDAIDQVFTIMKQEANLPEGNVNNTGFSGKELLAAISMTINNVTSTKVDKDTQTVDCNGTVHVSAQGTDSTMDVGVDYEVKPDLSNAGQLIIAERENDNISAVESVAGALVTSKQVADAAAKKKQFAIDHPAAANDPAVTAAEWNNAEHDLIAKADDLNDACRGSHPDQCDARDQVVEQLQRQDNICWGPDDAIEADKKWINCPSHAIVTTPNTNTE